ncbi:hypothetical protein RDV84_00145 [Lysobacter yananisis]|uniref:Phage tail protein n=1 Tax=Lysobacter yananisis TaxID=1003114 RepID=A0ABY9P922_9GAMM|nr:hypothetical protein [Lysobacter yananisis]WMT03300.1 hypothetical protein RDV84_00145 [Lysobacter yananisis]
MPLLAMTDWSYEPTALRAARSADPSGGATPAMLAVAAAQGYSYQPAPIAREGYELLATYGADFYDRIHVSAFDFALGNLIGQQERSLTIYNAFRRARILEALTFVDGEGITVYGQPAPPLQFAPLQVRKYSLRVSPEGPPTIDARIVFDFDEDQAFTIRVTGSRITAWPWLPDWGSPVIERLAWLTDVMVAVMTDRKQKRKLRQTPRRSFEFYVVADGQERRMLDQALMAWSARTFAFPVPTDPRLLSASIAAGVDVIEIGTVGLDYRAGGQAMLWSDFRVNEVVEVAEVLPDRLRLTRPTSRAWPAGTTVLPVVFGRLLQWPEQNLFTSRGSRVRVTFEQRDAAVWRAFVPPVLYRGLPVLEWRVDEGRDPTITYQRNTNTLDNEISPAAVVDLSGRSSRKGGHRWMLHGRDEHSTMRDWLYYLSGQYRHVWMPSWADDLVLAQPVSASDVALQFEASGYVRFARLQPNRRDLRIELIDGTVFYRRITDAVEIDEFTEQVSIDQALNRLVRPDDVRQISFMATCDAADDEVVLEHITDADGVGTVEIAFVGGNYDV